jgi:hypothetical protein
MALVEIFHVVASQHAIGSTEIKEGQLVKLNTSAEIVPVAAPTDVILGVAGDTKSSSASGMPGIYSGWQNRASDYFDETGASRKMTVYHSGGEFATDQFETDVESANVGVKLYASANAKLTAVNGGGDAVGVLTRAAGVYPSGVPGTDINGDLALRGDNSNQYIEYKLLV